MRRRKDRIVERGFASEGEGHSDGKQQQENTSQNGSEPSVKAQDQGQAQEKLGQSCGPGENRNRGLRNEPIDFGGVGREMGEVSPGDVGLAEGSPKAEAVGNGRQKRGPKGQA